MKTAFASFICSLAGGIIGILVFLGIFFAAFTSLINGTLAIAAMMVVPISVSVILVWAFFVAVSKVIRLDESDDEQGGDVDRPGRSGFLNEFVPGIARDREKRKWDLEARIGLGRIG